MKTKFSFFHPQRSLLTLLLCLVVGLVHAQRDPNEQAPKYYKIKSVHLPEAKRPEVRYNPKQLPFKQVGGDLPIYDGEQFHLTLMDQRLQSPESANEIVSSFLRGLQSPLEMEKQMRQTVNVTTAMADAKYIDEQIRLGESSTQKRLSGTFKEVSKASTDLVSELAADVRKQANGTVTVYRYDQFFDEVLIDNTGLVVNSSLEGSIVSLHGRFYNEVKPANNRKLDLNGAEKLAITRLRGQYKETKVSPSEKGELVLLPYADAFRYAWKTELTADGPYTTWIDAESGEILQLLPNFFFSDNAKGLVFNPTPLSGTKEMTFEVDAPTDGKYTLGKAGFMTISNAGADGVTGIATVDDDHSGTANFNVSPFNGTAVEKMTDAGYNGWFQQINVYAHTFNERKYYELIGSQNFGTIAITVNQGGEDNAHPNSFFTCSGTLNSSSACGALYNTGIDVTVVAHEFGHVVNWQQYSVGGGSMTGGINEGMADFWACSLLDMDLVAPWTGKNCSPPTQGGWLPRQIEALDVFPDHNSIGGDNEGHSAGQIIAWANYDARNGMNALFDLGTLSINLNMLKAMTTAGVGITDDGTDKSVHDSYLNLLKQLAPLYSTSRLVNKVLAGYARAGIFLAPKDAIIDINDSYLNRADASGPTFTVWTGRDYTFSGSNVSTVSPPFNTEFQVEVANDVAFTVNPISSGWLGGVVAGAGGTATWALPVANWNTLKAGDNLYYRLTTRTAGGGNLRQSWNPGNGFLANTPVGKAAINGTGAKDCSCSASTGNSTTGMALLPVLPLIGLILYRIRVRKQSNKR